MQEVGCVYLSFLGGGCALLSDAIKDVVAVGLGRPRRALPAGELRVESLGPLVVAIDAKGTSLFDTLSEAARDRLPETLHDLDVARGDAPPSSSPGLSRPSR